ncbi:hypothetical protein [Blastomonas natatoria]|uniref:hypothetical protein n=1 Tax=Blastomonas natatoria TaxID=34015 RepID=UPI000D76E3B7|nr:hypothetical protein [Blastomonas natatoria]
MTWGTPLRRYIIAAAVIVLACQLSYCRGYDRGVSVERASWQAKSAAIIDRRVKAAAAAEKRDAAIKAQGQAIIDRRKELDDATAGIPDQGLSARQRARVERERLRGQAQR